VACGVFSRAVPGKYIFWLEEEKETKRRQARKKVPKKTLFRSLQNTVSNTPYTVRHLGHLRNPVTDGVLYMLPQYALLKKKRIEEASDGNGRYLEPRQPT